MSNLDKSFPQFFFRHAGQDCHERSALQHAGRKRKRLRFTLHPQPDAELSAIPFQQHMKPGTAPQRCQGEHFQQAEKILLLPPRLFPGQGCRNVQRIIHGANDPAFQPFRLQRAGTHNAEVYIHILELRGNLTVAEVLQREKPRQPPFLDTRQHGSHHPSMQAVPGSDSEPVGQIPAPAFKIIQQAQAFTGQPHQLPPGSGKSQHFPAAARQFHTEEFLQFLNLPGIQALPRTIPPGGSGNAPSLGHFYQGFQSVQGQSPFCEKMLKHNFIVI